MPNEEVDETELRHFLLQRRRDSMQETTAEVMWTHICCAYLRPSDRQKIVISLHKRSPVFEAVPSVLLLGQLVLLDHGTHLLKEVMNGGRILEF